MRNYYGYNALFDGRFLNHQNCFSSCWISELLHCLWVPMSTRREFEVQQLIAMTYTLALVYTNVNSTTVVLLREVMLARVKRTSAFASRVVNLFGAQTT